MPGSFTPRMPQDPKPGPDDGSDSDLESLLSEIVDEAKSPATAQHADNAENMPASSTRADLLRRLKTHLIILKNNRSKKSATGLVAPTGRSFNYEEIYDEDPYGEETFPDARVWKVYNDEAQLFDLERIEAWRDALDVLLVFIGLFAAVVSAFLIESSKALSPDYAQVTAVISFQILRSLNNATFPSPSWSLDVLDPRFGEAAPTRENNAVNILWYTSLTISLSTALLAMLIKQWLHEYVTSFSYVTARERARIRQFRYAGLTKYRVPLLIDLLPTLVHLALGIFLLGLAIYLRPLNSLMFSLVVGASAIPYLFYLGSVVVPFFDPQCPYRSPPSFYIYPILRSSSILLGPFWSRIGILPKSFHLWFRMVITRFQRSDALHGIIERLHQMLEVGQKHLDNYSQYLHRCTQRLVSAAHRLKPQRQRVEGDHGILDPSDLHLESWSDRLQRAGESSNAEIWEEKLQSPSLSVTRLTPHSLREAERQAVSDWGIQLDVDGIVYLYHNSANTHVRKIALESFGGLPPSAANTAAVVAILDADLYPAIRKCSSDDGDNHPIPGLEQRHDRLIRALCVKQEASIEPPYKVCIYLMYPGETDCGTIFRAWLFPWFKRGWEERGYTFAPIFAFASKQHFPLAVWFAIIQCAKRHQPDHIVIQVLLLFADSDQDLDNSPDMGAVPLKRAMRNPVVRSIAMDYLRSLNGEGANRLSLLLCLLSSLLCEDSWYNTGRGVLFGGLVLVPPSMSESSHFLSTVLPSVLECVRSQISFTPSGEHTDLLRRMLTHLFAPQQAGLSWEAFSRGLEVWQTPLHSGIRAITAPSMIRFILAHFHRHIYPQAEDIEWMRQAVHELSEIFTSCFDVDSPELAETICSNLREMDLLPVDLMTRGDNASLCLLWSGTMCQRIVEQTWAYLTGHQGKAWFDTWLTYLHAAPERLVVLCSGVIASGGNPLVLCRIRPQDPLWPTVVKELFTLHTDQTYLTSMVYVWGEKIEQPRRQLAEILNKMRQALVKYHPVLRKLDFDMPQVDQHDNLITHPPGQGTSTYSLFPEAVTNESGQAEYQQRFAGMGRRAVFAQGLPLSGVYQVGTLAQNRSSIESEVNDG